MHSVKTILCVPGPWASRQALIAALLEQGLLFLGPRSVLMDVDTKESLAFIEVDEAREPRMRRAFEAASSGRLAPEVYAAIESHAMVVYVVLEDAGTEDKGRLALRLGTALLDAGGLGVKVESAGKAHSPDGWREIAELQLALWAFLVVLREERGLRSCGMHNLGLPEGRVTGTDDEDADALDGFLKYLAFESPELKPGQTFGLAAGAPSYRLGFGEDHSYPPGDLFHNPFGAWTLERTS